MHKMRSQSVEVQRARLGVEEEGRGSVEDHLMKCIYRCLLYLGDLAR